MVQSVKNSFAPISRIPPGVLSLIPEYCKTDRESIELTPVCHDWREIFVLNTSLWTRLDCARPDKTIAYIQRSKGLLLEISSTPTINNYGRCLDAFLLMIPHIGRLKALTVNSEAPSHIIKLAGHLRSPVSLLERLEISVPGQRTAVIKRILFDGNLPSLRDLRLLRLVTDLPRRGLSNLTTFDLRQVYHRTSVTQFLDRMFTSPPQNQYRAFTPRLLQLPYRTDGFPPSPEVARDPRQATPLHPPDHFHLPTSAMVTLRYPSGLGDPPSDYFPRSLYNLRNIPYITSVSLDFNRWFAMRFNGPSGSLLMSSSWEGSSSIRAAFDHQTLQALNKFPISSTETLTIDRYRVSGLLEDEQPTAYQTLLLMNNLQTLTLTGCTDLSFFLALNPFENNPNAVVCLNLEEVILCAQEQEEELYTEDLLGMAKVRLLWARSYRPS